MARAMITAMMAAKVMVTTMATTTMTKLMMATTARALMMAKTVVATTIETKIRRERRRDIKRELTGSAKEKYGDSTRGAETNKEIHKEYLSSKRQREPERQAGGQTRLKDTMRNDVVRVDSMAGLC